jgi:hypothetical protein
LAKAKAKARYYELSNICSLETHRWSKMSIGQEERVQKYMAKNNKSENDWINSVLIQQNLVLPKKEHSVDLRPCWAQIEEYRMVERIGEIVADINGAAGYCMLELQDYLPPQTTILSIRFSKRYAEYVLEIMAREACAAAVVFYSLSKVFDLWEHYFRNQSRRKPSISLKLDFHPAEILNDDLQRWFSYLLSRFDKKLKPNAGQQMSEKEYTEFSAAVRKKSA